MHDCAQYSTIQHLLECTVGKDIPLLKKESFLKMVWHHRGWQPGLKTSSPYAAGIEYGSLKSWFLSAVTPHPI